MSDPSSINYQPLADMQRSFAIVFKQSRQQPRGKAILFTCAVAMPVGGLLIGLGAGGIVLGGMAYLLYLVYLTNKYQDSLWLAFAQANGWEVYGPLPYQQLIPPSMDYGRQQKCGPIIKAQLGTLNCDLFNYTTTVGGGKSARTWTYGIVRMPLPKTLPHMLLLSKKTSLDMQRPDIASRQDIQLEGDFNRYFQLQIEQGQQIDALTVITPDVMQALIQYNQAEDIEILGSYLFFVLDLGFGMDHPSLANVQYLVQSVVGLSTQILQNISFEQV